MSCPRLRFVGRPYACARQRCVSPDPSHTVPVAPLNTYTFLKRGVLRVERRQGGGHEARAPPKSNNWASSSCVGGKLGEAPLDVLGRRRRFTSTAATKKASKRPMSGGPVRPAPRGRAQAPSDSAPRCSTQTAARSSPRRRSLLSSALTRRSAETQHSHAWLFMSVHSPMRTSRPPW